ncbi:MAG TPA: hypothetical protein DIT64_13535 [Verrucomicrobiales bacterium]|nr:hypothetical protein [Verrucomicrobiales bacterium]
MLSFRDEDWIFRHGPSRFEAWIMPGHRKPADVMWGLELHYKAGGARWRRVEEHVRPEVDLAIRSWKLKSGRWTDLTEVKYWDRNLEDQKRTGLPWFLTWEGGMLDLCHRAEAGGKHEFSHGCEVFWQVREREGGRFLVELAAGVGREQPAEEKELVLPDGTRETGERDPSDFWRETAAIYALEWVPFGKVTVRVPRNARDHLACARHRAHELLGISTPPEAYHMQDFLVVREGREEEEAVAANSLHDDVFVKLHFHGYHEDE